MADPDYLALLVAQIRIDLHDTDQTDYRWTDATLQRHIERALAEFSNAAPLTKTVIIDAVNESRTYDLGTIDTDNTDLNNRPEAAFSVEWPYDVDDQWPNLVPFRIWDNTLYLLVADPPVTGDQIKIWYHYPHTISASAQTIAPDDLPLIQLGAAAYAALEMEAASADKINLTKEAGEEYASFGRRQINRFNKELWWRSQRNAQKSDSRATWSTANI